MKTMSPQVGFWDKLRTKLYRIPSTQTSTSVNYDTATNTVIPNGTKIHSTNNADSTPVTVNVYDMLWINDYVSSLGIGVYHTGVVVHGTEYSYGGHPLTNSGIFAMLPKDSAYLGENYSYKVTLSMGYTDFTASDVALLLENITTDYRGDQYHLLHKNCNHFSDAFIQLLCGRSLPKWINRLAAIGSKLPFIERTLPVEWLTPHQQITSDMSREEQDDNSFDCIDEQSTSFNTQNTTTAFHGVRRISTMERIQNCVHRLHATNNNTNENSNKRAQNHSKLLNDLKYDTYSLVDIPLGAKTQPDHNWYSYLTRCGIFYKFDSTNSTPSSSGSTFDDENGHDEVKQFKSSCCGGIQQRQPINMNQSNTESDPHRNNCTHSSSDCSCFQHNLTKRLTSHNSISLPSTPLNHSAYFHQSSEAVKPSISINCI
ncbi:unnamed protein product [Schistosoma turkestanicum]|nr:unnamed protein product [Schistosoma turkestanicum]